MNKLVIIESAGPIEALGGISGPIKTPSSLSTNVISDLINSGKVVYEINPRNYNEKVKLTRLNVNTNNFQSNVKKTVENKREIIKQNIARARAKKTEKFLAQRVSSSSVITTTSTTQDSGFVSNKNNSKKRKRY